jgi:lipoprotein signal peptidase
VNVREGKNTVEWRPWLGYGAAVVFVLIDRVLKALALALSQTSPTNWPIAFSPFLNHGALFSIPLPIPLILGVSFAVFLALVLLTLRELRHRNHFKAAALTFVILGALSNMGDRLILGATIDYLLFFGRSAWNIADGMVIVGVIFAIKKTSGDIPAR